MFRLPSQILVPLFVVLLLAGTILITGNYEDKVKIMFAGKVAPDVIFMYATALSAWVALDALAPLSDMIERDTAITADDYFQAGLDTFSLGGQLYGLPKDASAEIVFPWSLLLVHRFGQHSHFARISRLVPLSPSAMAEKSAC